MNADGMNCFESSGSGCEFCGDKNETTDAEPMKADGSFCLRIGEMRFLSYRSDDVGSSEKSI